LLLQDYVNTLATIKQENGEKYLILKKKYYPEFYSSPYTDNNSGGQYHSQNAHQSLPDHNYNPQPDPQLRYPSSSQSGGAYLAASHRPGGTSNGGASSPSLLDEVMAGFVPPSRTMGRQLPTLPTHYAGSDSPPPPAAADNGTAWPQPIGLPAAPGHASSSHGLPAHSGQYYTARPPVHPADLGLPLPPPSSRVPPPGRDSRQPHYDRQTSLPQYDNRTQHSQAAESLSSPPYNRQHSSPGLPVQYDRQPSVGGRYAAPADDLYNPSAFSPHAHNNPPLASSRQSVSSLASFSSSGGLIVSIPVPILY
jgi:hypothetical protein